jgi:hypothetical protein
MRLFIKVNGISLHRYILMDTLLCTRENNIVDDVPDRIVCKIYAVSHQGFIDVYIYASSDAVKHVEYHRGDKVFHESYDCNAIVDRRSFKTSHRVLGMRGVSDSDAPLFVNWKWMSKTFKREFFGAV